MPSDMYKKFSFLTGGELNELIINQLIILS